MKKISDQGLAILSLLVIPAFFFGAILGIQSPNPHWWQLYNVKLTMMFLTLLIASISFGTLVARTINKKK